MRRNGHARISATGRRRRAAFTLVELPVVSGRGAHGFTLVELLVVVAIVALLVAILTPTMSVARSLARSTVCRHNLGQIDKAFRALSARAESGRAARRYPPPENWPGVPAAVYDDDKVFLCPEDDPGEWNPMATWTVTTEYTDGLYYHGGPRFVIHMEPPSWGAAKRPGNGYTDYVFEDGPGIVTNPDSWGYDGTFRVYDLPGRTKRIEMYHRTCGQDNRTYINGKPLFAAYGDVRLIQIPLHTSVTITGTYTSYAINKRLDRPRVASDTLVLMDYDTKDGAIADPAANIANRLRDGARHLGKNNVLYDDGSVGSKGPTELDPQMDPDPWSP